MDGRRARQQVQLPAVDEFYDAALGNRPMGVERHALRQARQGTLHEIVVCVKDLRAAHRLREIAEKHIVSAPARMRHRRGRIVDLVVGRGDFSARRNEGEIDLRQLPVRIERHVLVVRPGGFDRRPVLVEYLVAKRLRRPVAEELVVRILRHGNRRYRGTLPGVVNRADGDAFGNERHDERNAHRPPMRVERHVLGGIPGTRDGIPACVIDHRAVGRFREIAEEGVICLGRLRRLRKRLPLLRGGNRADLVSIRHERDVGKPYPMRVERHVLSGIPGARDGVQAFVIDHRAASRLREIAEEAVTCLGRPRRRSRKRLPLLRGGNRADLVPVRHERDVGKPQPLRVERHVLDVWPN